MDFGIIAVFALVGLWLGAVAMAIGGTVDALNFAPVVWERAGYSRKAWAWQAAFVMFLPGALVYSGMYLILVRPKLVAAERSLRGFDASNDAWGGRRRWYDRLSKARRSPYEWDKAARRWWMWIPNIVVAVALAALYLGFAQRRHEYYVMAATWAVVALTSAVKAGFWYGECMRLTGRRPDGGGPLRPPPNRTS